MRFRAFSFRPVRLFFSKSFTVIKKERLIGIKSRKRRTVNDFLCGLSLWGKFVAPLRIPVVVRSTMPGSKNGTEHEKGGSEEEPPNRKRIVEASVLPNEASQVFPGNSPSSQALLHGNAHRLLEHGKRGHNQHNANT